MGMKSPATTRIARELNDAEQCMRISPPSICQRRHSRLWPTYRGLRKRFPPDITPELHPGKMNLLNARIRARDGVGKIAAIGDDGQDSPAGGHQLTVSHRRSRMQDADAAALSPVNAGNGLAGFRRLRIAARRDHDADEFAMRHPA